MGVAELAKGVSYAQSIRTGWNPPKYIMAMPDARHQRVREKLHILVEGEDIPPPLKTFKVCTLSSEELLKLLL